MSTTVYWIRHGEAEGNLYRRCHGHYNSLITTNGKAQLDALRRRFDGVTIDAIYSSDLFRAWYTGQSLAEPRGLTITTHPGLREISLGPWEDLTWGVITHRWPKEDETFSMRPWDFKMAGAESMAEATERGYAALCEIVARHPDQTIAIFSHGALTRAVMLRVQGLPSDHMNTLPHGDNTCVTTLSVDRGALTLVSYADNSHLGSLSTLAKQVWWRGSGAFHDPGFSFRSVDFSREGHLVSAFRADAWQTIYGTLKGYEADAFLRDAREAGIAHPTSVMFAEIDGAPRGLLQMDFEAALLPDSGHISFFYLDPTVRCKGLGVQLLGQAVSTYRLLGRRWIVLRVSEHNAHAIHFYRKYGFTQFGTEEGALGTLLLMKLDISVPPIAPSNTFA